MSLHSGHRIGNLVFFNVKQLRLYTLRYQCHQDGRVNLQKKYITINGTCRKETATNGKMLM